MLCGTHEHLHRAGHHMGAKVLRDRDDVVARHHQGLAGALAVALALFQHGGEFHPGLGARMLAPEFALAVPPARG
jgi:hypothetical protein